MVARFSNVSLRLNQLSVLDILPSRLLYVTQTRPNCRQLMTEHGNKKYKNKAHYLPVHPISLVLSKLQIKPYNLKLGLHLFISSRH